MKMTETELLRTVAARYREVNLIEAGKQAPVPPSLDKRMRQLIRREKKRSKFPIRPLALVAAALLTVGTIVLGLPLLRPVGVNVPVTEPVEPVEHGKLPAEDAPKNDTKSENEEPFTQIEGPAPGFDEVSGLFDGVNEAITDAVGSRDTTFSRRWLDYTYNIAYLDSLYRGEPSIVDSEAVAAWGAEYASRSIEEQERMPTLYQAVHELGIPEEDFASLNRWRAENGGEDMILKDGEIHALYLPEDEARVELKNPLALAYGGAVYAWSDLLAMQRAGTLEDTIPASALEQHIRWIADWCSWTGVVSESVMLRYIGRQAEPLDEAGIVLRLDQVTAALIEHGQLSDLRRDFLTKWLDGASMIGWLTAWVSDTEPLFDPEELMAVFEINESEGEPLPPVYRIIRELNIGKENFKAWLAAARENGVVVACTDEMIDWFYWPEDEAIRVLKQPSALLSGGTVYSWSEIMTMRKDGTLFDVIPAETVEEHIDTVIRICDADGIVTLDDMIRYLNDETPTQYYLLYDANAETAFGLGGGGISESRYPDVFLTIPGPLIFYVGQEEMNAWVEETEEIIEEHPEEDRERYFNLYEFLKFFAISRETLEDLYYAEIYYSWDYPLDMIDVLYCGDDKTVYEYFYGLELAEPRVSMDVRSRFWVLKTRLLDEIGPERFEERFGNDGRRLGTWSIAEAAYAFGLSVEDLEGYSESAAGIPAEEPSAEEVPDVVIEEMYADGTAEEVYPKKGGSVRYAFDFNVIEDNRTYFEELISCGERPVFIDERIPCRIIREP